MQCQGEDGERKVLGIEFLDCDLGHKQNKWSEQWLLTLMGSSVIQTSFKFPLRGDVIYFHFKAYEGQCLCSMQGINFWCLCYRVPLDAHRWGKPFSNLEWIFVSVAAWLWGISVHHFGSDLELFDGLTFVHSGFPEAEFEWLLWCFSSETSEDDSTVVIIGWVV